MQKLTLEGLGAVVLSLVLATMPAWGQNEKAPPPTATANKEVVSPAQGATDSTVTTSAAKDTSLAKTINYSGGFFDRPALTGDWGGWRNQASAKGLNFFGTLTQTVQGNMRGGTDYKPSYWGRMDYGFELDTGKAGLWPGGYLKAKAETSFGDTNDTRTGALLPVNFGDLYPRPFGGDTALSELYYMQFLSEQFGITFGKMSPRDSNVFAGNETSQFMNTAFNINPAMATTVPTHFLGAGVIVLPTEWLTVTALALDSEGEATVAGFDTAFDRGVSIYNQWEFKVKPFGLPGHQRVSWTWSDRSRIQFQQNRRAILENILQGQPAGLARKSEDWSIMYDFDQYVYTCPEDPSRGWGFFGRYGAGDEMVNPVHQFYSLGIGGKGMIPGREKDTFGVGYYYLDLSDKLPGAIRSRARDEQGVELFYNIEITPWLHVTPDLQVIHPARNRVDTTWVAGIRFTILF